MVGQPPGLLCPSFRNVRSRVRGLRVHQHRVRDVAECCGLSRSNDHIAGAARSMAGEMGSASPKPALYVGIPGVIGRAQVAERGGAGEPQAVISLFSSLVTHRAPGTRKRDPQSATRTHDP